jgi:hypothetical protein
MLEQHGSGDHLPFALHQEFKQPELAWLENNRSSSPEYASGQQVHFEIRDLHADRRRRRLAPSDYGGKTRCELGQRERLDHVVVGPGIEAGHTIVDAIQGRQEKHGSFHPRCTEPAEDGQPVQPGQHTVEDDYVPGLGTRAGEATAAIDGDMQIMCELPQALDNVGGGFGIILDQQQAHDAYPAHTAMIVKLLINNL